MIVGEAGLMAAVAALAAIVPSMLAGRLLLALLQDTGQVAPTVSYGFGPIALARDSASHSSALPGPRS